jgi:glucan phosphoethanolaminetransferase (alkaline phosphatase superfamily)
MTKLNKSDKEPFIFPVAFILLIALIPLSELLHQVLLGRYFQALVMFLYFLSFFLWPVILFQKNVKIYLAILSPLFLIIPLNLLYTLTFSTSASSDLTLLFLNTNKSEATELFNRYWVPLLIIYTIYISLLVFLVYKCVRVVPSKVAYYIAGISLVLILLLPFLDIKFETNTYYDVARTTINNTFPTSIGKGVKRFLVEKRLIKSTQKERDAFKYSASLDTSLHQKQVVLLIIGESCRYYNWGINGYSRNTSPHLNKRTNLISFNNVSTGASLTEYSVPLILSGVGAENFDKHVKRKGIFAPFNEVGFNTYWISNQPGDGGNISVHAGEAQKRYSILPEKDHGKDMTLLDTLRKILKQPGDKKFIVIHTMGSHFDYTERYPDSFDIFKPSYKTQPEDVNDRKFKNILVNTYDNTIAYTDAVIDSMISMTSKLNEFATVAYIADHGEDLMDGTSNATYHMMGSPPSKYVTHVPFFVWYSGQLQQTYPAKVSNLLAHKNSKLSSENLIYTLTSLAGITYPKQDPAKNVSSANYKDSRQLLMGEAQKIYPFSVLK